jgi:hypothetical protein
MEIDGFSIVIPVAGNSMYDEIEIHYGGAWFGCEHKNALPLSTRLDSSNNFTKTRVSRAHLEVQLIESDDARFVCK